MDDLIVRKTVKAVGVTFNNPNGEKRQNVLRELADQYCQDLSLAEIEMEEYEYSGQSAYHIVIDGRIVGNLPADLAAALKKIQLEQQYTFWLENGYIIGGEFYEKDCLDEEEETSYDEMEREPYYGVMFTLCLASPEARAAFLKEFDRKHSSNTQQKNKKHQPHISEKKKQKGIWKLIVAAFFILNGLRAFGISTILMDMHIVIGGLLIIWWIYKDWNPKV